MRSHVITAPADSILAPPEHPPEVLEALVEGMPTELGWRCARASLVYGLVDPKAPDRVRYVGKSRACVSRYFAHIGQTASATKVERAPVYVWIADLLRQRRVPRMVLLEIPHYTVWLGARERFFMHYYIERGVTLLNSVPPRAKARCRATRGA